MNNTPLQFITQTFPNLLKNASSNIQPLWGKMNLQQMVEHVTDFFKISSNQLQLPIVTPEEYLPKYKAFILSEKEFKENTKAPEEIVPTEPLPLKNSSIDDAILELEKEIKMFEEYFKSNKNAEVTHPVFGSLTYNEWVLLHYKHVLHHSKQFKLV